MLLKFLTPLSMFLAGLSLLNLFSVYSVKPGQSAFSKLMKVLFGALVVLMLVDSEMKIGRWSDPRLILVDQVQEGSIDDVAKEISGDDEQLLVTLVGVSSFKIPKFEFWILSEMRLPLASSDAELSQFW